MREVGFLEDQGRERYVNLAAHRRFDPKPVFLQKKDQKKSILRHGNRILGKEALLLKGKQQKKQLF